MLLLTSSPLCSMLRLLLLVSFCCGCLSIVTVDAQPVVNNITSTTGCQSVSAFVVNECYPGSGIIVFSGSGLLWPVSVTVGGLPCPAYSFAVAGGYFSCSLPAPPNYLPGQYFDVVLMQGRVNVTQLSFPAAVAFSARPSLSSVTSQYCPLDWTVSYSKTLLCPPGAVLTVVGAFFNPDPQLSVLISLPPYTFVTSPPIACTNVTVLSSSTLTCVLPTISNASVQLAFQSYVNRLQVWENATSYSDVLSVSLYSGPHVPALSSVSGCQGSDPSTHGVFGCVTGASITLIGSGFNQTWFPRGAFGVSIYEMEAGQSYPCQNVRLVSDSLITCQLPYIARYADEMLLPIRVQTNGQYGNWLYAIGYSNLLYQAPASQSTTYFTAFIVCLVLLAFVSVLLAVVFVLLLRLGRQVRKGATKTPLQSRAEAQFDSESSVDLEMS